MIKQAAIKNNEVNPIAMDVVKGAGVAILSSYLPLVAAFTAARAVGINVIQYEDLAPIAASLGVATVAVSLPLAYKLRNASVKRIVGTSALMFSLLGTFAAFTI